MKKVLNLALLISFVLTILVPLTGIHVHKLASTLFLLLSVIHTIVCRKKLGAGKFLLLALVVVSFATGLLGMVFEAYPAVLILHRMVSIGVVFFCAIHIFVYHKRILGRGKKPAD